jgi:hypothetical protein
MELDKEEVAWRETSCVSAQEFRCAVCAWIALAKTNMHYDLRSRHVCFLPRAAVQLLSQSPYVHVKGELHPLAQSFFIPPSFDSRFSRGLSLVL